MPQVPANRLDIGSYNQVLERLRDAYTTVSELNRVTNRWFGLRVKR